MHTSSCYAIVFENRRGKTIPLPIEICFLRLPPFQKYCTNTFKTFGYILYHFPKQRVFDFILFRVFEDHSEKTSIIYLNLFLWESNLYSKIGITKKSSVDQRLELQINLFTAQIQSSDSFSFYFVQENYYWKIQGIQTYVRNEINR